MEHPLIGNIDDLSIEDLSAKVNELNSKLAIATRTGNGHLCNQLRMAIESYQNKYRQRLEETWRRQDQASTINFDDKINIK